MGRISESHHFGGHGGYRREMRNDSIQAHRTTPEPFDQDSGAIDQEGGVGGACPECRAHRCENCANSDCSCAHPFAAIARAIVELDVSVHRTRRVLSQAGMAPDRST
jgi:hypothetical protein